MNRCVQVKIGASESVNFSINSGVPQGSNLGPLLFSIFLNDVASLLPPGCRLFYADDTKIFKIIKNISDCQELQNMLSTFADWCTRNMMSLSIAKCNIISFHRKNEPIMFEYDLCGSSLARVDQIKDLGVTLDRALTFRVHYDDIICRANRQMGFIFKIANEFRDPLCLKSLYCSLVRSILETNSVVWCPFQAIWITRFESIQRKFVRYALRFLNWRDPMNLPPYEERCRLLGIETLEVRRMIAQASFAGKLFTGEIDCPSLLAQMNIYAPERPLRQRDFLFLEPRSRNYAQHEPIRAICHQFNIFFSVFDFNVSADVFRNRLLSLFRTVERS